MNPDNPTFRTPEEERRAEEYVQMKTELATARAQIAQMRDALEIIGSDYPYDADTRESFGRVARRALAEVAALEFVRTHNSEPKDGT